MNLAIGLPDEPATQRLGSQMAKILRPPVLVGMSGDLGAGKTTLVRAMINVLLPGTRVKSPTYTLIESYALPNAVLHHLDLYRIEDPEELAAIGLDDWFSKDALVVVEWPEKGFPVLPEPDLTVTLTHSANGRECDVGAHSKLGEDALAALAQVLLIESDPSVSSCRSEKPAAGGGF